LIVLALHGLIFLFYLQYWHPILHFMRHLASTNVVQPILFSIWRHYPDRRLFLVLFMSQAGGSRSGHQ